MIKAPCKALKTLLIVLAPMLRKAREPKRSPWLAWLARSFCGVTMTRLGGVGLESSGLDK